jgi:hypothetical protein
MDPHRGTGVLNGMTNSSARAKTVLIIRRHTVALIGGALLANAVCFPALAATDIGKKACAKEARTLCPKEMKSMSRKRVEACMIAKVEKTSPTCKAAMYRIKAEREKAGKL